MGFPAGETKNALHTASVPATPPADAREWARQARFIQSRGFSTDIIRRLLKGMEGSE